MRRIHQLKADTREWIEAVIQVRSGLMKAAEAARRLGISRKTYYKREKRVLAAMMAALADRSSGRPGVEVDEEKERLKAKVADLEQERTLLQNRLRIRDLLNAPLVEQPAKKKGRKGNDHGAGSRTDENSNGTVVPADLPEHSRCVSKLDAVEVSPGSEVGSRSASRPQEVGAARLGYDPKGGSSPAAWEEANQRNGETSSMLPGDDLPAGTGRDHPIGAGRSESGTTGGTTAR